MKYLMVLLSVFLVGCNEIYSQLPIIQPIEVMQGQDAEVYYEARFFMYDMNCDPYQLELKDGYITGTITSDLLSDMSIGEIRPIGCYFAGEWHYIALIEIVEDY